MSQAFLSEEVDVVWQASGYQGSRVLEHNQTGRYNLYVEARFLLEIRCLS